MNDRRTSEKPLLPVGSAQVPGAEEAGFYTGVDQARSGNLGLVAHENAPRKPPMLLNSFETDLSQVPAKSATGKERPARTGRVALGAARPAQAANAEVAS